MRSPPFPRSRRRRTSSTSSGSLQGTAENADGTPVFELERTPTRFEAITMLVRLLGAEDEALSGSWSTPFTDLTEWARAYVGYAYAKGLTDGTSETTLRRRRQRQRHAVSDLRPARPRL